MSLAKCVANSFHQLKPIKSKLQKASSNNEFNKKIWHSEIEPNFAKVIGKTNVIKPLNKHGEYLIDSKIKVNLIKLCVSGPRMAKAFRTRVARNAFLRNFNISKSMP